MSSSTMTDDDVESAEAKSIDLSIATPSVPSTSDTTQPAACRLLHLPIELRERIYSFALLTEQTISWPANNRTLGISPNLLATCRQVYQEAAPSLYKQNKFAFYHPSDCNVFRHIMDYRNVQQIAHVSFKIREKDTRLWTEYFTATTRERSLSTDLPNLQSLKVYLKHGPWGFNVDVEDALRNWPQIKTVRLLCMALENRTRADVHVLVSMRLSETQLEQVRRLPRELFSFETPDYVRTRTAEIRHNTRAALELTSPRSSAPS